MKSKSKKLKWFRKVDKRWIISFVLLVLPFCLIYFPIWPQWIGRVIVYCLYFSFAPLVAWWWSLNPRTVIVGDDGKLARPGNEKSRRKFEVIARIGVFLFGVLTFTNLTLSLNQDVYDLIRGKSLLEMAGVVVDNDTPFGAWYLSQSIRLQNEPSAKSYGLIFSLEPRFNRGEFVRFLVLPRSRMIVARFSEPS